MKKTEGERERRGVGGRDGKVQLSYIVEILVVAFQKKV